MSDTPPIMALDLPMLDPLPEEIQKYFDICQEKLGMVPNVLQAYAFDAATHFPRFTTISCWPPAD
jgi:hypothetical protein